MKTDKIESSGLSVRELCTTSLALAAFISLARDTSINRCCCCCCNIGHTLLYTGKLTAVFFPSRTVKFNLFVGSEIIDRGERRGWLCVCERARKTTEDINNWKRHRTRCRRLARFAHFARLCFTFLASGVARRARLFPYLTAATWDSFITSIPAKLKTEFRSEGEAEGVRRALSYHLFRLLQL